MTVRVVLDTNVVLSALVFRSGRLAWLRAAWQSGQVTPVVCRETTEELLRALTYPKFGLSPEEREQLLADLLPYAEAALLPNPLPPGLPVCRDPDDAVFLALACAVGADALVTGDSDLLALVGSPGPAVLTPQRFRERVVADEAEGGRGGPRTDRA
jgi:putative PIN family toxin of toxin-antitoxin system